MEAFKVFLNQLMTLQSEETWNELSRCFHLKELEKGDLFAEAGVKSSKIAFVQRGTARTFITDENGKEFTKFFNVEGSLLAPYTSIITDAPSPVSIEALSSCELLIADYQEIDALAEKHLEIQKLLRKVPEMLFVKNELREIRFVMCDAKERYHLFKEEFPGLEALVPQYHIASYLGITPIQLSRIRN